MYIFVLGKPVEVLQKIDEYFPIDLELGESISDSLPSASESIKTDLTVSNEHDENASNCDEELRETGTIKPSVYKSYWTAIGHLLSFSILLSMVLMQSSRNMTDWWLAYWVSIDEQNTTNVNTSNTSTDRNLFYATLDLIEPNDGVQEYLLVYALFAVANSIFTLFRAFLFAYGGITAATKIHKVLLRNIIKVRILLLGYKIIRFGFFCRLRYRFLICRHMEEY